MKIPNPKSQIPNYSKGFIFLEILIAVALIGIACITLLSVTAMSLNLSHSIKNTTIIDSLLREELEALRSFRDGTSWANGVGGANTSSSNPYYLFLDNSVNPGTWVLRSGVETVEPFTRKVVLERVSRDQNTKNIESTYNPSFDDPDTRKATAIVTWNNATYQVVTYLTNWQK